MPVIHVNGATREVRSDPATPLLWVLRDELALTGTKYSCGIGVCGSCTVLADGQAVQSCTTPLSSVGARKIVTIEGLAHAADHPVQRAWIEERVAQCGYCQAGQILAAAALLNRIPHPTDADIDEAMTAILCRCGTYQRIRKAIHRAAGEASS